MELNKLFFFFAISIKNKFLLKKILSMESSNIKINISNKLHIYHSETNKSQTNIHEMSH